MVQPWKYEEVKLLKEKIEEYPVVGIVDLTGIPAAQLQSMRRSMRDDMLIRVSKKNLMKRAIEESNKENIEMLNGHFRGIPGFIFTNMNPFRLFKLLEANKVPAPAKAGQIATKDIVVPKGDTGLPPGPVIGELSRLGIKAKVEGGSIAVLEDTVVVREGEAISADVVNVLNKLKIEPMEIGLDLLAVHEDNLVFTKKDLRIDETEIAADITQCHQAAFNLAMNAGIFTGETTDLLIARAFREAVMLASEVVYVTGDTADQILSKAYAQAVSLANEIANKNPDAVGDALKDVKIAAPASTSTQEQSEEKKEEEEIEEKKEDAAEEAAAGLGALFG